MFFFDILYYNTVRPRIIYEIRSVNKVHFAINISVKLPTYAKDIKPSYFASSNCLLERFPDDC